MISQRYCRKNLRRALVSGSGEKGLAVDLPIRNTNRRHARVNALPTMTEWKIQSRAHSCAACGRTFADQEAYHTLLFDEKTDFRRTDICQGCWQAQYSDGARDRKGFVSHWQGVYEAPPPPTDAIR